MARLFARIAFVATAPAWIPVTLALVPVGFFLPLGFLVGVLVVRAWINHAADVELREVEIYANQPLTEWDAI